ncbi:MAG: outer membrane beta-barrel protein [Fibrobacterota bacterium]|nr:outer membrane beta-barrel protein [Fibrobacterota bacterium]QQS07465.1 MAG: outer membrane beta-barrel protein [Fibrobacterota bacterium]
MNKTTLCLVMAFAALGFSKNLSIGGKVGVIKVGDKYVPTTSVTADYKLSHYISWRTDAGAQFTEGTKLSDATVQVPTNLLIHPLAKAKFDPYIGPGGNLTMGNGVTSIGYNGVAGFMVNPSKKQGFGLEFRYSVADYKVASKGNLEGSLLGKWETKF